MTVSISGEPRPGKHRQRRFFFVRPDWQLGVIAAVIVAFASAIPRFFSPTFYYWDDMMQSFLPLWRHLGEEIRSGRFPLMEPNGWVGGNIAAEAGYGIFNPVNVANSVIISYFNDLSLASYFIVVQFLSLLAFGVYMLTRDYGANRALSLASAVAIPFSGFTLFYEAARWPGGLMAFAWTTIFWWAMRRFIRQATSPFLPFLLGFMTMTAGNPYGAVGIIIVLLALAVEMMAIRHWRQLIPIILVGSAIGLTAIIVFFPLLLSASVTVRTQSEILNDLFLQPDMSSLLASSTSALRPRITGFWAPIDNVPSSYWAWFALPLIPWLNFRSVGRRSRQILSLYVVTGAYFLLTFAPSTVFMFRWPVRLIEYVFLGLMIVLTVVASAGLRATMWKRRLGLSIAILIFGSYRAWSFVPDAVRSQFLALVISLILVVIAFLAYRHYAFRGLAVALILGTLVTLGVQSRLFIPHSVIEGLGSPTDASRLRSSAIEYQGNTLQIFQSKRLSKEDFTDGRILYGNQILNSGTEASLGRYSGISFTTFSNALCMNYRAETCPAVYDKLFRPSSTDISVPLADLLRLQTVVVQNDLIPVDKLTVPAGWSIVDSDKTRTVLRRQQALPLPGTVSWVSEGVLVDSATPSRDVNNEKVKLGADTKAGTLAFARLAWPGYEVQIDGVKHPVSQGPAGVIEVDVPAGAREIDLSFVTPGLLVGLASQAAAWLFVGLYTFAYYYRRYRAGRKARLCMAADM